MYVYIFFLIWKILDFLLVISSNVVYRDFNRSYQYFKNYPDFGYLCIKKIKTILEFLFFFSRNFEQPFKSFTVGNSQFLTPQKYIFKKEIGGFFRIFYWSSA